MWIQTLGSRLCTIKPELRGLDKQNSPRSRGEFSVMVNLRRTLQRPTRTRPTLGLFVEDLNQQGDAEGNHSYRRENPQP